MTGKLDNVITVFSEIYSIERGGKGMAFPDIPVRAFGVGFVGMAEVIEGYTPLVQIFVIFYLGVHGDVGAEQAPVEGYGIFEESEGRDGYNSHISL